MIWTVFGFYEATGKQFVDNHEAKDGMAAMRLSALQRGDGTLVVAVEGQHAGADLEFPGETVVEAGTFLELFEEEEDPVAPDLGGEGGDA